MPPTPPRRTMGDWLGDHEGIAVTFAGLLIVVICIGILVGGLFGFKAFKRYQKRQDAQNNVAVTKINIERAQQQAKVVNAEIQATVANAQKKYQESIGIRRAQDEIQSTLTPLYVQHEAIQAQLAMARSENHTMIWAPSGTNGAPLVFPQNP